MIIVMESDATSADVEHVVELERHARPERVLAIRPVERENAELLAVGGAGRLDLIVSDVTVLHMSLQVWIRVTSTYGHAPEEDKRYNA